MDTWQDEMSNNFAGHTPYYGVPYLTSEPDSAYNTTPDSIGFAVDVDEHTSKLTAVPQVNWLKASYPQKVNWLQASKLSADNGAKMSN
jgi:hypothetical protein